MTTFSKIKVVYVVPTLGHTGPSRQLINLTKHLDKDAFEVAIITLSQSPKQNLDEMVRALNFEVICINLSRIRSFITGKRALIATLTTLRPDIIHSQGLPGGLAVNLPGDCKFPSQQANMF